MTQIKISDSVSININSQYRLIYQYVGGPSDPPISAEMIFTGQEVIGGLSIMAALMQASEMTSNQVQSNILMQVLTAWGSMKTGQDISGYDPHLIAKVAASIRGNTNAEKRDLDGTRGFISAILAANIQRFNATNTMIVKYRKLDQTLRLEFPQISETAKQ